MWSGFSTQSAMPRQDASCWSLWNLVSSSSYFLYPVYVSPAFEALSSCSVKVLHANTAQIATL